MPGTKVIVKLEKQGAFEVGGVPCSACIKRIKTGLFNRKSKAVPPLVSIAEAANRAIERNDYSAYAEAREEIDLRFYDIERRITSLLSDVQDLAAVRNAILSARDRADAAMRASPQASYFVRRIEANRAISNQRTRAAVFSRDGFRCVKCETSQSLSVDHKKPVLLGGGDDLDNLQTLCLRCNCSKGSKS